MYTGAIPSRHKRNKRLRTHREPDITTVDRHIGSRMQQARRFSAISWSEISNTLGMSRQGVVKYECGRVHVAAYTLWHLARLYKTLIRGFFEGLDFHEADAGDRRNLSTIELQLGWMQPIGSKKFKDLS
jgi:transcriptional regulator with XRE-family HTH domain